MKYLLGICLTLAAPAYAESNRTELPITQIALPDGDIRYTIPVTIGASPPIQALLDTGSTGLRIFRKSLEASDYTETHIQTATAFSAGDELTGTIGTATIGLGTARTDTPIPFELIDSATCLATRPKCGAALAPASYGIGGDGLANQGFRAIIGLSLTPAPDSTNPLTQIGAKRWMIILPEPIPGTTGALIINPSAQDIANAQSFQLHKTATGWLDALPGCLNNLASAQKICGPTSLDTGSPGIIAFTPNAVSAPLWSPGTPASLSFATSYTTNLTMPFTVDRNPGTGLLQQPAPNTAPGTALTILAGFLPFFYNAVIYDAAAGTISLQPRPDAPNPVSNPLPQTDQTATVEVIQLNTPTKPTAPLPTVITPTQ
jgi:hypothetical protein